MRFLQKENLAVKKTLSVSGDRIKVQRLSGVVALPSELTRWLASRRAMAYYPTPALRVIGSFTLALQTFDGV